MQGDTEGFTWCKAAIRLVENVASPFESAGSSALVKIAYEVSIRHYCCASIAVAAFYLPCASHEPQEVLVCLCPIFQIMA